jgi:dUTP pyrophosphatase
MELNLPVQSSTSKDGETESYILSPFSKILYCLTKDGDSPENSISQTCPHITIIKTNDKAVIPTRAHPTDIGLDLVAIHLDKLVDNGTTNPVYLYDTGLVVEPPNGYYIEIVPRSSIIKTGWMLANNIGIIDPSYRGNLYIALVKVHEGAQPIELPFCKAQMILRACVPQCAMEVSVVSSLTPLVSVRSTTQRNTGGFGSTGDRTDVL